MTGGRETPYIDAPAAGWEDVTRRVHVTDGGRPPPTFMAKDGRIVDIFPFWNNGASPPCHTHLMFLSESFDPRLRPNVRDPFWPN
jgi:hypothetical protein